MFSDKTGTLTQNKMVFKKCSVDGKVYGETAPGAEVVLDGMDLLARQEITQKMFSQGDKSLREFFTMLAVCHTVMVENGGSKYSASSPDELALVNGSKDVGIVYNSRSATTIGIQLNGG